MDDGNNMVNDEVMQVRTMDIPLWLSTLEVTKHLVGHGKGKALEAEYESTVVITGKGSGTRDPKAPGFNLPHLHVTMSGTDVRQLGRLRRALEDSLIDYVIEDAPTEQQEDGATDNNSANNSANPPPSLGRLLYALGLSAANASPKTKDRAPDRSVLARSHFPVYLHTKRDTAKQSDGEDKNNDNINNNNGSSNNRNGRNLITKKVWMNVLELPRDGETKEYHGRFLASRSFMNYYRNHFHCRVDIYGVWGDNGGKEHLLCDPYVLITSEEKANVDKCVQYVEHRIRDHEEKFEVSRVGGRRVLRGEKAES